MASIIKVGGKWRAQVRRKGMPAETKTFDSQAQAKAWAVKTESNMLAMKHQDTRIISKMTLGDLIGKYVEEVGAVKRFGKNKSAVLESLRGHAIGKTLLPDLNIGALTVYIQSRQKEGAGGVTIAIDLSYMRGILKAARDLWRLPVDLAPLTSARANMVYLGLSPKSKERERRPTADEIARLCKHFDGKPRQRVPMSDIINFAIETAMRSGEITALRWQDLNEADKTIIIKDRKHPTEKKGNDQEVPLLGKSFDIIKRQKASEDSRIFPTANGTISSIFPRACTALGIVDLRFHDLRHEGVSRLFEQGYTIEQVSLVSGHRDWKMLARYLQLRAKDLHRKPTSPPP